VNIYTPLLKGIIDSNLYTITTPEKHMHLIEDTKRVNKLTVIRFFFILVFSSIFNFFILRYSTKVENIVASTNTNNEIRFDYHI
jgi:hypothetical protein